jgi:hypothetical protein
MSESQTISLKVWPVVSITIPVSGVTRALEIFVENIGGDERVQAVSRQAKSALFYGKCAAVCLCLFLTSKSLLILQQFGKTHPLSSLQAMELARVVALINPITVRSLARLVARLPTMLVVIYSIAALCVFVFINFRTTRSRQNQPCTVRQLCTENVVTDELSPDSPYIQSRIITIITDSHDQGS